jgi:GT2 family glycosyltransferase
LKISIIIPSFQRELELDNNIYFWQKELEDYVHHIIVANASNYEALKTKYSSNNRVIFLNVSEKFWWSESVNCAIKKALDLDSSHVLVTNDDMIYPSGLIELFFNKFTHDEILTIPQLQNDGIIYNGSYIKGFFKDFIPNKNDFFDSAIIDSTNGSCLFIPTRIFENIGFFNYLDLPHYFSDIEFILRARNNGYKLRLLNFKPIIQGPPTEFYKRFSYFNILLHKGSPLNTRAVIFFGHKLYNNHFNLFFGMGLKYILIYLLNILKFQFKKFKKTIIIRND